MNLASLVHAAAARSPSAPAVTDPRERWNYGQFAERIARTAAWLRALPGVQPGDRIGIAMENCAGYLQVQYACWHAGLCVVPMNAKLHPREVLLHPGELAGARLLSPRPRSMRESPGGGAGRALRAARGRMRRCSRR